MTDARQLGGHAEGPGPARHLPEGTVTFLFTDIEGSTALVRRLGDAYGTAVTAHRRVLREAFAAHDGVEVDTQGDSFLVVFARAHDAVAAAVAAQRALADEPTLAAAELRVRIGLHTGEPRRTDEGYVGLDVHRGARIANAAHGGQILVSDATAAILGDAVLLVELGAYRLKDFEAPVTLHQVAAEGLEETFPPVRGRAVGGGRVPAPRSSLIGRVEELAALRAMLAEGQERLLTLAGPGGAGKTRLAVALAEAAQDDFADGVVFVDLAAVSGEELVAPAVAQALGVVERGDEALPDSVAAFLRARELLLVVDNFEHVLRAAPLLAAALDRAPALRVLATSRAPLRLRGERIVHVPPLEVPDLDALPPPERLAEYGAVALFLDRARAAGAEVELTPENARAVAEICARLDGLPLAVELAAARVALLPPPALAARLHERLPLASGGLRDVATRQRTLRDAIDWSYRLLSPGEQRAFRALAVFVDGFSLDDAESVAGVGMDDLAALVDQSLVHRLRDVSLARFAMLETVREHAAVLLEEAGEHAEAEVAHAERFLELAERGLEERQRDWIDRVETEQANMRAALATLVRRGDGDRALTLCRRLHPYWQWTDRILEGTLSIERALAVPGSSDAARAEALFALGALRGHHADPEGAAAAFGEGSRLARAVEDPALLARGLFNGGMARLMLGDLDEAATLVSEAVELLRRSGPGHRQRTALHVLGEIERDRGDFGRAGELLRSSLELSGELSDDLFGRSTIHSLGDLALDQGDLDAAAAQYRRSLRAGPLVPQLAAHCLAGLAAVAALRGDPGRAAALWAAVERFERQRGWQLHPRERPRYERVLAGLPPPEGEAPTLEDAAALALED